MLSETSCGIFCKSASMVLSKLEQTMPFFTNEVSSANRNRICNTCSRVSFGSLQHCMSAYVITSSGHSENHTRLLCLVALPGLKEDTLGCVMGFLGELNQMV
jgi:hypothetical protein